MQTYFTQGIRAQPWLPFFSDPLMKISRHQRKAIWAGTLFLLLTVNSCSQVPYPASHTFSSQETMQSVNHWDILAHDTAAQLHQRLTATLPSRPNSCVSIQPDDSLFGLAFTKLLKANLLQLVNNDADGNLNAHAGYALADAVEESCTQVKVSAQVIKHRTERQKRIYPGTFTFLTSAVAVMRDFEWYEALVGAGLVADLLGGTMNSLPHNEVLITTKITKANRLLSLQTDMYYINDQDTWHYEAQKPLQGRQFPVVGGQ